MTTAKRVVRPSERAPLNGRRALLIGLVHRAEEFRPVVPVAAAWRRCSDGTTA